MKRVLFALCIGTVALGVGSCDDEAEPSSGPDVDFWLCPDYSDSEVPVVLDTTTFLVTTDGNGFNVDGQNTNGASTPVATDAAGCYQHDTVVMGQQGLDARFGLASSGASTLGLDLATALESVRLRISLIRFHGTTDPCLSVELAVDTGAGFIAVGQTETKITNGISPIFGIDEPLALVVPITRPDCTPGTYGAGGVPEAPACATASYGCTSSRALTLDGVRLRVHVVDDPSSPSGFRLVTNTESSSVTNPTMIAGHVRFTDTSVGAARCGTTPLTGTTFDASLQKVACDLGLGASWGELCSAIVDNLDLHDRSGALTTCAPGASVETSDANSISFAAYLGN